MSPTSSPGEGSRPARTKPGEKFFYGGQAVIEGVMMRGPHHYAVAVRLPRSGEIAIERGYLTSHFYTHPFWRLPFVRGLALMGETLHLGMKSLIWSANMNASGQDIEIGKREIFISMLIAMVGLGALFIVIPLIGAGTVVHRSASFSFVALESVIRVVLILGYMAVIGLLPDVKRVFQYHGAEHMTINAFEADWPLTPESVQRASRLHPRCGTGFLIVVMVVSIVLFIIVGAFHPNWFWLIFSRVAGIPVIAGISVEWIRLLARHRDSAVGKFLLIPILATQRLTTRVPDLSMLEVAIAAFTAAREGEETDAAAGSSEPPPIAEVPA